MWVSHAHFPPFRRSYLLSRMTTPPQFNVYLVPREIKDDVSNECCGICAYILVHPVSYNTVSGHMCVCEKLVTA